MIDEVVIVGKVAGAASATGLCAWGAIKAGQAVSRVMDAVELVRKELRPNGGTSLRDIANETATGLERVEVRQLVHEARHGALVADLGIGEWQADLNGRVTKVNRAFCRLFGRPAEDLIGMGWEPQIHPDDRARVVDEWLQSVREQREAVFDFRIVRDGGEVVECRGQSFILRDRKDQAAGFMGTTRAVKGRAR